MVVEFMRRSFSDEKSGNTKFGRRILSHKNSLENQFFDVLLQYNKKQELFEVMQNTEVLNICTITNS